MGSYDLQKGKAGTDSVMKSVGQQEVLNRK